MARKNHLDSWEETLKETLENPSEQTTTRSKDQTFNRYSVYPNPLHRLFTPILREEIPNEEQYIGHAYIDPAGKWIGYGSAPRHFSDLSWYVRDRYESEELGNKSPRYSEYHTFYSFDIVYSVL